MVTVWTNGCFDVLHFGHFECLRKARDLGDRLIVGINSDESVRRLKGPTRPIHSVDQRRAQLMAIKHVDEVVVYDEPTPCRIIQQLKPDIVVKGFGYHPEKMPEAIVIKGYGGKIVIVETCDLSTTRIMDLLAS